MPSLPGGEIFCSFFGRIEKKNPFEINWPLELSKAAKNFLDKFFRFKTSLQTCVALKEKESGSSWLLFSCPFTNDTTFLSNVKIRDTLQVIGPVLLTVTLIVTWNLLFGLGLQDRTKLGSLNCYRHSSKTIRAPS